MGDFVGLRRAPEIESTKRQRLRMNKAARGQAYDSEQIGSELPHSKAAYGCKRNQARAKTDQTRGQQPTTNPKSGFVVAARLEHGMPCPLRS